MCQRDKERKIVGVYNVCVSVKVWLREVCCQKRVLADNKKRDKKYIMVQCQMNKETNTVQIYKKKKKRKNKLNDKEKK